MKITQHVRRFFPSLLLVIACLSISCKQVNEVIDNLLTFDIDKSVTFPIYPQTPTGMDFVPPGIPIGIDSAELAKNKTTIKLVKTLKLTKLAFTPDDATYPMTNISSLSLAVGADSLHTILLASYSGVTDKVTLTNADFAANAKDPNNKFFVTFNLKNAPSKTVNIKTDYTLTFTADPF